MTIKQIYNLAVELGKKADPRSSKRLKEILRIEAKRFNSLSNAEKDFFDKETLINPYSDSRYYTKNPNKKIKKIMVGIDITGSEILLADRLNQIQKNKIDLVIAHHPVGNAFAALDNVMHLQTDLLANLGIPVNIAESLLEKRIKRVSRDISAVNHYQTVDAARLLNIPLMCIHTPADNMVYQFLKNKIKSGKPEIIADIIKILKTIPEYKEASIRGAGPTIFVGNSYRRCGKIVFSEITGGTSGAKEMYEHLARAGVGTIISMHMGEEYRKEAEKNHINVVIAGHMSSDSLGLNLILDTLAAKKIDIIPCSGFIRVDRNKNIR